MAIWSSSSAAVWKISSRGKVSRICSRSRPSWLSLEKPEAFSTSCTLRRTTGMRETDSVYAAAENRPRKRRSPITSPLASNRFTPT